MNYSTFSTSALAKMLNAAAAGSAEHEAIKRELKDRANDRLKRKDTQTMLLFDAPQWAGISKR